MCKQAIEIPQKEKEGKKNKNKERSLKIGDRMGVSIIVSLKMVVVFTLFPHSLSHFASPSGPNGRMLGARSERVKPIRVRAWLDV